ncbi:uncharacterized protein [Onthophagus taurus]|uniref:uncharacterized protein n=1 Tax=Onthophagus taurus TaxID=166361 RepID=UPI0039BEBEAE
MNTFIIISSLVITLSSASPLQHVNVAEDTLGNYKFDFDLGDQTKIEERNADGSLKGSFTYVDLDGHDHQVNYEAGEQGFIAHSADIPVPVQDLPENVQAFNQHAKVFNAIQADPAFQETPEDDLETPINPAEYLNALRAILSAGHLTFVEDTPENNEAKEELFRAHAVAVGL